MRLVRDNHQGGTQFAPVLSGAEVNAFFAALRKPKYRALFMTCYAAGLRLGERFPQYASRLKQQLELHQVLESTPSPAGAAHQR